MLLEHIRDGCAFRHLSVVPKADAVIIDFHLIVRAIVGFVNDAVVEYLPETLFRNLKRLHALHSFVMDRSYEIFGRQDIDDFVCHLDKVALDKILSDEVSSSIAEPADFESGIEAVCLRILAEQQQGSHSHLALLIHQFQITENLPDAVFLSALGQSAVGDSSLMEYESGQD